MKEKIYEQVALGNIPDFLRKLVPIHAQSVRDGKTNSAIYYVAPDYLAVGSESYDYFLTPLTPRHGPKNRQPRSLHPAHPKNGGRYLFRCGGQTHAFTDSPSAAMTTVPIFIQLICIVTGQRKRTIARTSSWSSGRGPQKGRGHFQKAPGVAGQVAIYGWHVNRMARSSSRVYAGRRDTWADYVTAFVWCNWL